MKASENETVDKVLDDFAYLITLGNIGPAVATDIKNRIEAAYKREIEKRRECLRIIMDNLIPHTIKSIDGKYVNNGAFLPEEFVDDEQWRKAPKGAGDGK